MKDLIFIAPIFNEENNINFFLNEVNNEFSNSKIILVDDGSTDNSWLEIKKKSVNFKNLSAIKLAKNYGKNNALKAGFNFVNNKNALIVTLDSDLQHPLKNVKKMLNVLKEDISLDYCDSVRINENSFFRGLLSNIYNKFLKILNLSDGNKMTDFKMIKYNVVESIKSNNDPYFSYSNFINSLNFKKKTIFYEADKRLSGKTKFNFLKLTLLATANIIFYSSFLHYAIFFIFLLSLFTSLFILFFFSTVNLSLIIMTNILIGLFSLNFYYLKRVLNKLDTQNYIISEKINIDQI